ncbi:transporter substrate-binding domain-containing protein [Salinisphaera sp. LB1]|uniref:transporter substrate-binding domain-containing protein n=1 Tax=Salinisphaera sp. LB1 TaxID=2183911 RepID=UPI000D705083|nr:transporter substrate-binding domain-containing protein [Salinisphaera sp. LB1]AWN17242.1 Glutamine ABC transporter, periplasmic glutamine-binding protein [Salinisphaera sp. LB1]
MTPIKRCLRGAFAAAMTAATVLCAAPSALAAEPTLTVATDPSFVPFESLDIKTRKHVGYDIDMIHAIAKRAGFKVRLRTMDFNGIIPALQAKSVDMAIAGITITKERAQKVDFSNPYYDSGLKLMVRADNNTIKTIKDLKGKSVSTKIGSTSYNYLTHKVPGIGKVVPYPGTSQMYMALISGNVDAAFYDVPNVLYFIKTKGHGKVKAVGPTYAGQQYGIAFPQNSKWVQPVNKALTQIKKDGTFTKIYKKWFDKAPPADLTK